MKPESSSQLKTLTRINVADFQDSLGLDDSRAAGKLLGALCWLPARRFARQMLEFDRQVAADGLQLGSRRTLSGYAQPVQVVGQENIPSSGPVLVLSNHPGMSDTLVLFTSLPRPDLRIIASARPFLQSLPNVSRHLLYVSEDASQRMGVVRSAVAHLRQGGVILTFPAGEIEPDPACMPGAVDALDSWSDSIAIFARMIPELSIVTAIVSGVVWPAAMYHPITRLRREQFDRERLGAALQILIQMVFPRYRPVAPRVTFGPAIRVAEIAARGEQTKLLAAIRNQARQLIRELEVGRAIGTPQPLVEALS